MTQLELASYTPAPSTDEPLKSRRPTIQERWETFDAANPHVFESALRLARTRLERGERRIGVKALWEELRRTLAKWALDEGEDEYKLNNDYTACLARKLLEVEPRLVGVIELRERRSK